jgi:hypothetical protein
MNGPLEFKAIVYITYFDSIESFQHSLYQSQSKLKFMLPYQYRWFETNRIFAEWHFNTLE